MSRLPSVTGATATGIGCCALGLALGFENARTMSQITSNPASSSSPHTTGCLLIRPGAEESCGSKPGRRAESAEG